MSVSDLRNQEKPIEIPPYLTEAEARAYINQIRTPVEMPVSPVNRIPQSVGDVKKAYTGAGGGIKGILSGAATGLGKLAELFNTEEGQKIMAGFQKDPHLARAYLGNAERERGDFASSVGVARKSEADKLNAIGELVRQQSKEAADYKTARELNEANIEANKPLRDVQIEQARQTGKLREEENARQEKERTFKEQESKTKPIVDMVGELYRKKSISEKNYAKVMSDPLRYKVTSSAHKVFGIGPGAGIEEGVLHTDADGNKAYVFEDGTFNEVR